MSHHPMMQRGLADQELQLAVLSQSVARTGQMASAMNDELEAQTKIIGKLNSDVDDTELEIRGATYQAKNLIKITKDNKGLCCMFLLILALFFVLIILVVYL